MKAFKLVGIIIKKVKMQQKIKKTPTVGTLIGNPITPKQTNKTIIGVDPGLHFLGIGIIEINTLNSFKIETDKKKRIISTSLLPLIENYTHFLLKIKTQRKTEEKLFFIYETICKIIEDYNPDLIIVEDSFVGFNKNSAIKLGLTRGSILTAIGKHKKKVEIISPSKIKMQLTQKGNATKEEIEFFFQINFKNWKNTEKLDNTDALAAAFCGICKII